MMSVQDELEYLMGESNLLWNENSKHEAILLLAYLYDHVGDESRRQIIDYLIGGPPADAATEGGDDYKKYEVAEILGYLKEKTRSSLTREGEEALLKATHPRYKPNYEYPGIREYLTYSEATRKEVVRINIRDVDPDRAIDILLRHEDTFETTKRDVGEELGVAIILNWNWGCRVIGEIVARIEEFDSEVTNPIMWGMRAALRDVDEKAVEPLRNEEFLESIRRMVSARPVPQLWIAVPGLLEELIEQRRLDVDVWNGFAHELLRLFATFDFDDREDREWIGRAHEHPIGRIILIYLQLAENSITKQKEEGMPYAIEPAIREAFEAVLATYEDGSRHGLCLLASRYSWFEAVSSEWAQSKILPYFSWRTKPDAALVAWSGYARSRSIAKPLVENFEDTYFEALKRLSEFGPDERSGILGHIAAIFWFGYGADGNLRDVIGLRDRDISKVIVEFWGKHLQDADSMAAANFFRRAVIPAWRTMRAMGLLDAQTGTSLRWKLLQLIPYSGNAFDEIVGLALITLPEQIQHVNLFLKRLAKSGLERVDEERFIGLLTGVLKADQHPEWHRDDWAALWRLVERSAQEEKTVLMEEFARKNMADIIGI